MVNGVLLARSLRKSMQNSDIVHWFETNLSPVSFIAVISITNVEAFAIESCGVFGNKESGISSSPLTKNDVMQLQVFGFLS